MRPRTLLALALALALAALAFAAFALAACAHGGAGTTTVQAHSAEPPLIIGQLVDLSGSLASYGGPLRESAALAVEQSIGPAGCWAHRSPCSPGTPWPIPPPAWPRRAG